MSRLPSIYIPHGGGPCFFMEWTMGPRDTWDRMGAWLCGFEERVGSPKALLVISAHWEEHDFTVNAGANPALLFDYYGFPKHTYELTYDAPGSPEVADRVLQCLEASGLRGRRETARGWDHGIFVPFKLMYPKADIPLVQLSLRGDLDAAAHIELGRALAPLRDEGVLIIGSGASYHGSMGRIRNDTSNPASDAFDVWLTDILCSENVIRRDAALAEWERGICARQCHPREEHLLPLMVVAGAAKHDVGHKIFTDRVMGSTVSAFQFG